ncbi:hypothetical protein A4X13_0g2596 [Tilletia indica]|uniref:Nitrogen permease regulator 2 n=1 Tax=Tilletia indica TaxID=43049 RepID=A0A177TXC4_9BASI|nr:hypothetical protein A4X13_0g2596 [Tilletia indica]
MTFSGLLGGAFDLESNAFLDIQSIFFATFHPTHGPQILFQMPEGSITQDEPLSSTSTDTASFIQSPPAFSRAFRSTALNEDSASSSITDSPLLEPRSTNRRRTPRRDTQINEPLFDFGPIKDYIIPKKELCGKLVACNIRGRSSTARSSSARPSAPNNTTNNRPIRSSFSSSSNRSGTSKLRSDSTSRYTTTSDIEEDDVQLQEEISNDPATPHTQPPPPPPPSHRPTRNYKILGFPVFLSDESRYARNDFRFNMCFVFDASADTRPYEPVVRKIARILTGLEESSSFLSNEKSRNRILGIIEQLYQDLNSYCESFVPLPVAPHTSYVPRDNGEARVGILPAGMVGGGGSKAGTPNAGLGGTYQGSLFIANSANNPTISTIPTAANPTPFPNASPYLPNANSSPSPSRVSSISNVRGRRRGRTIDSLKRDASITFTSTSTPGSTTPSSPLLYGTRSTGNLTPDISSVSLHPRPRPRTTSVGEEEGETLPLSPQAAADALLEEWEKELPHGLGRTVRDAINIKLFPIYPNPPAANDWDVPVALLDLGKRVDDNWDLTMKKIFPFINGVNHVKRIAELADADLGLTRQCMEHLLYYECIIMIDLFQYSNIYILRPLIASIATLDSIQRECADYVIRPGKPRPPYSELLKLYASALRPGITVSQWMEDLNVERMYLDVRRFVTFGVIKGFVRRVHRFPIFTPPSPSDPYPLPQTTHTASSTPLDLRKAGLLLPVEGLEQLLVEGTHCDDELCVKFGVSWLGLERMLLTVGYGAYGLAREMEEQRHWASRAEMRAAAEEEGGVGGRSFASSSGFGGGAGRYGGSSGPAPSWGWAAGSGSGSGGGGGGGGGTGYTSAWGTSSSEASPFSSYNRRQSGASTQHTINNNNSRQQTAHYNHHNHHPQTHTHTGRARYPSDAGWGSVSSFGAQMSGFHGQHSQQQYSHAQSSRGSTSEATWVPPSSEAGGGGEKGGYDRVTGERLPANATQRSPSPIPGPDWSAIYSAARTCGHMGDVQIFLR